MTDPADGDDRTTDPAEGGLPAESGSPNADDGSDERYARLETIVENVPLVLFTLDDEGTFTLSRGRGLDSLDLDPDEVVGESAFDVYAGQEGVVANLRRALDGEEVHGVVEVEGCSFETWYQPVVVDDRVDRVIGVAIDVTERVRHERRLDRLNEASRELVTAESEDEVAAIAVDIAREVLDQRFAAMWSYDADADVLRPIAATPAARELDATGGESTGVIPADTDEMAIFRDGESRLVEDYRNLDAPARPGFPLRALLVVPIEDHGLLGVGFPTAAEVDAPARDLIEILARNAEATLDRVERERALRERERELERQNERLDAFARVVSHDLRSPLGIVAGHLDLARETGDESHLDTIEETIDGMGRLVEDVLTLAREGRVVGETAPVDLGEVVERSWTATETADASLAVEGDLGTVVADGDRLHRLLANLFRNAVEHAGPDVTVRVGPIDGGFAVEDDGPGIPADARDRVFEAGYSTAAEGTGFGLAIVGEIAEAHGWDVSVAEGPDGGTRFEITGVEPARGPAVV